MTFPKSNMLRKGSFKTMPSKANNVNWDEDGYTPDKPPKKWPVPQDGRDGSVIVSHCKKCGEPFRYTVAEGIDLKTKREIGEYAAEGHKIETMTLEHYRANVSSWGHCTCKKIIFNRAGGNL